MKHDLRSYTLSLISYLDHAHLVAHPRLISSELTQALKKTDQPDRETTRHLLALGHPKFLKIWCDKYGIDPFHFTQSGGSCPLELLHATFGEKQYLKALKIITPAISSSEIEKARRLLRVAHAIDAPQIVETGARRLGVAHHDIVSQIANATCWGPAHPKMSAWTAQLLTQEFDEKDPAWRDVMLHAVRSPQPLMMAALVKLGVNIQPYLQQSNVWGAAEWIERLDHNLSSAHRRLTLMRRMPSIEDCLKIESNVAVSHMTVNLEPLMTD